MNKWAGVIRASWWELGQSCTDTFILPGIDVVRPLLMAALAALAALPSWSMMMIIAAVLDLLYIHPHSHPSLTTLSWAPVLSHGLAVGFIVSTSMLSGVGYLVFNFGYHKVHNLAILSLSRSLHSLPWLPSEATLAVFTLSSWRDQSWGSLTTCCNLPLNIQVYACVLLCVEVCWSCGLIHCWICWSVREQIDHATTRPTDHVKNCGAHLVARLVALVRTSSVSVRVLDFSWPVLVSEAVNLSLVWEEVCCCVCLVRSCL